jgi:hypothetical protein
MKTNPVRPAAEENERGLSSKFFFEAVLVAILMVVFLKRTQGKLDE